MRRIFCYVLVLCACLSCRDHVSSLYHPDNAEEAFSVCEARSWFESGNGLSFGEDSFMPSGDFTPCWDKAVTSGNKIKSSVDVPILSDYRYECIISSFSDGRAIAKRVSAVQRLLLVKDSSTEEISQFILMLIPDYDYYRYHRNGTFPEFRSSSSKGRYSGIAIYIHNGRAVRVNRYRDGIKVAGVFIPSDTEEKTVENFSKAKSLIGAIKFLRGRFSPRTKYYGGELDGAIVEDDWWTPPEFPDWPDPDPIDPDPEPEIPIDNETPPPITPQEPEESAEQTIRKKLAAALGDKVSQILSRTKIERTSILPLNTKAVTYAKLFDNTCNVRMLVYYDLTERQRQLVMAHEFMHLVLFQISQNAGSVQELGKTNPELLGELNKNVTTTDGTQSVDANASHHSYMGSHVDDIEALLKSAFPGESDEFYEYGKWGGGLTESNAFDMLSKEEQKSIIEFLMKFDK